MKWSAAAFSAVFAAASATGAAAQSGGTLPAVLSIGGSTRAMALGDAYALGSGHADVIFYHPAGLTNATGFGLSMQRWGDEATSSAASAALQWLGGGVGVGLRSMQYSLDPGPVPAGQDHLFAGGPVPVSERAATFGYARELLGVRVGLAGQAVEARVGSVRDASVLVDVGVATSIGRATLGLTLHDLGDAPTAVAGVDTPTRLVLGAGAYGLQLGFLDVGGAVSASYSDDHTALGGGLELGYWPIQGRTFVARIGAQQVPDGEASPLTFGAAFWGDDLVVEWAYRSFGDLDEATHRFEVRWR